MNHPSPQPSLDRHDAQVLATFNFMRDLHGLPPVAALPSSEPNRPELVLLQGGESE